MYPACGLALMPNSEYTAIVYDVSITKGPWVMLFHAEVSQIYWVAAPESVVMFCQWVLSVLIDMVKFCGKTWTLSS